MNLAEYIYGDSQLGALESVPHYIKDSSSPVKVMQIWDIMRHITNGVAFIHDQREVHRDLKPQNSMLPLFKV